MNKFFYKLFLLMLGSGLFAQECHCEKDYAALQSATIRYVDFINHLGSDKEFDSNASLICAADCKKVFNGRLQLKSRDDFVSQLLALKETQGHWAVNPVDILISPMNRTVVLRLVIAIEKAGVFTAIVILRYSPEFLVTEINEVFNQFEGREDEVPKIR